VKERVPIAQRNCPPASTFFSPASNVDWSIVRAGMLAISIVKFASSERNMLPSTDAADFGSGTNSNDLSSFSSCGPGSGFLASSAAPQQRKDMKYPKYAI
jgi:hypothetical protein